MKPDEALASFLTSFVESPQFQQALDEAVQRVCSTRINPALLLYTVGETAEILKISKATLIRHTEAGLIQVSRMGTRVLYAHEDIQEAIKIKRK